MNTPDPRFYWMLLAIFVVMAFGWLTGALMKRNLEWWLGGQAGSVYSEPALQQGSVP